MTGTLKPVGFYSDTEFGEPGQPTLASSQGSFSGPLLEIVTYLRDAHCVVTSGSGVWDELDPARPLIGALKLQTDGVWVWPSSYPYYVEKYAAEVPGELLSLARDRDWEPPQFGDDVDFDELIPFGE